jgi:CheY-like chemotaxis protein
VLVVDDETAVREVTSRILRAAGFDVKAAASGEEAIELLSHAPDVARVRLILLDVSMPGLSSRDLRAQLRAHAPDARVVYFTGYAYEAADAEDIVLEKPVPRDRLLTTIRNVLDGGSGRAEE